MPVALPYRAVAITLLYPAPCTVLCSCAVSYSAPRYYPAYLRRMLSLPGTDLAYGATRCAVLSSAMRGTEIAYGLQRYSMLWRRRCSCLLYTSPSPRDRG
eukprot:1822467-Rhodomonas_salina.1